MEKEIHIYGLHDPQQYKDEKAYWSNRTSREKLHVLEVIREAGDKLHHHNRNTSNENKQRAYYAEAAKLRRPCFEEFFALLNAHNVQYLVVGGYAFAVHAEPRYTKDVDIFYRSSPENAKKIIQVLADFGFESLSISVDDLTSEGKIIQLGYSPLRIDLLNKIDGIDFNSAWNHKLTSLYGEEHIFIIGKEGLIKNKEASGREQDLLDVKRLKNDNG